MAKVVEMNEEVMMNEETAAEVVEVKESKAKVIFNKIKKPLAFALVLAVGIGAGLAMANIKDSDEEVEETAVEE